MSFMKTIRLHKLFEVLLSLICCLSLVVLAFLMQKQGETASAIVFLVTAVICVILDVIYQVTTAHGIDRLDIFKQVAKFVIVVAALFVSYFISVLIPGNYGFMASGPTLAFLGCYLLATFSEVASAGISMHLLFKLAN